MARACLWDTLGRARNPRVRFDESTIPGIESFGEFYSELISQFESVSYGDSLFALVVLLPTNRYCELYHQPTFFSSFQNLFLFSAGTLSRTERSFGLTTEKP